MMALPFRALLFRSARISTRICTRISIRLAIACVLAGAATGARPADALGWTPTGGPAGGQVRSVLFVEDGLFGNVALAGTIRGLYRSTDAGDTWSPVASGLPGGVFVHDLAAGGPTVILASRDHGVFRSTDAGQTWSASGTGLGDASVQKLVAGTSGPSARAGTGANVFFALSSATTGTSNLFRSIDDGVTWSLVPDAPTPFGSFVDAGDAWIGNSGALLGMFRSTDGGLTWQTSSSGLPLFALFEAMTESNGVVVAGSTQHGIHRSTDAGQTWSAASGLPEPFFEVTAVAGEGHRFLASFWGDGIYRSTDAGQSWQAKDAGLPGGWGAYLFAVDLRETDALAGLLEDGVFRSADEGDVWSEPSTPITGTDVAALLRAGDSPSVLFASTGTDRVFYTEDGGDTWQSSGNGVPPTAQVRALGSNGNVLFGGTQYEGVLRSLDSGLTWSTANTGYPIYNGTAGNQYREVGGFAAAGGAIFAGTGTGSEFIDGGFQITGAGVYRSTDDGATWQEVNDGFPIIGTDNFGELRYDPIISLSHAGALFASTFARGIFRSTDGGDSWVAVNAGLPQSGGQFPEFSGFVEHAGAVIGGAIGFAVGAGGTGLFQSTDGGSTWTLADNGIPSSRRITGLLAHEGALYASVNGPIAPLADDGVYRSTDDGATWEPLGTGIALFDAGPLAAPGSSRLLAGTGGFGVWSYSLLDPSSVEDFPVADPPRQSTDSAAHLLGAAPNPSRDHTTVSFVLEEDRQVRLTLHDATGRKVRTLVDGWIPAGEHQVPLGTSGLPANVYYLDLRTGRDGAQQTQPRNGASPVRLVVLD